MYELLDKPAAIKEVQRFLLVLSDIENSTIPRVSIDGIYGPETRDAVKEFQSVYGLRENGLVDLETFDLLYFHYSNTVSERERAEYVITEAGFPFALGSQNIDVLHIHLLFEELSKTYTDIGTARRETYFSKNSENITKELQKIFDMEITGVIDALFYERMLLEIDSIRSLENTETQTRNGC
jgi:peptidoglycan hydrolase-like protein with peptidoglycan-binding domain